MSLTLSMMNGLSGLKTNQTALEVISNNVTNVNTDGYSRKVHHQESKVVGGVGSGVDTAEITRQVNEFLRRDVVRQGAASAGSEVLVQYFERMQELFGSPGSDTSISHALDNLATAMEALATSPELATNQSEAVAAAEAFARQVSSLSDGTQALRRQAEAEIASGVEDANTHLKEIADLNNQIARAKAVGHPTADLEDKRDMAVKAVGAYFSVQEFTSADGQVNLYTKGGKPLVAGGTASTLEFSASPGLNATESYPGTLGGLHLNPTSPPTPGSDITGALEEGRFAALFEMRDSTLPSMTAQLDQLTGTVRDTLNRIHNRGANTPAGSGTAAGDTPALWGSRGITNTGDTLTLSADVTVALLDGSGNELAAPLTIAAGSTTPEAIRSQIDSYLSGGGHGTATWVDDRLEIKLANGTSLAIRDQGLPADGSDAVISFDANGDAAPETYYGLSNFLGLNDLFRTGDPAGNGYAVPNSGSGSGISGTLEVRADILSDPRRISRGPLTGTTPDLHVGAGDNQVAQDLAAAFQQTIAFSGVNGGPSAVSTTLGGYASAIVSGNASAAAASERTMENEAALMQSLESRLSSETGVNMDEELANMVIYQNAYAASARIIQVSDELFEVLLSIR